MSGSNGGVEQSSRNRRGQTSSILAKSLLLYSFEYPAGTQPSFIVLFTTKSSSIIYSAPTHSWSLYSATNCFKVVDVVLFLFHFIKWVTTLYCHILYVQYLYIHSRTLHMQKHSTLCKHIHSFPDNVLSAAYVRTYVTTYTYVRMYKSELHTYVHMYVHTLPTTSDLKYVSLTIATLHREHQVRLEVGKWRVAVLWLPPWQQTHTKPNQLFNKH